MVESKGMDKERK